MVDTRPFLFPGYLFDICSGCLIFFEVVFKMRAGFFSFAIDHEYMAVEQDQAVIPAVLHGVAADGQPWAFHGTALAEQEGAVVIETGIDCFAAEDDLVFDQPGTALHPDRAQVAGQLSLLGKERASPQVDAYVAVTDVTTCLFIITNLIG